MDKEMREGLESLQLKSPRSIGKRRADDIDGSAIEQSLHPQKGSNASPHRSVRMVKTPSRVEKGKRRRNS